jgi:hypothetical protein
MRSVAILACVGLQTAPFSGAGAQDQRPPGWNEQAQQAAHKLMWVSIAAHAYAARHKAMLPADLSNVLESLGSNNVPGSDEDARKSPAELYREYLVAPGGESPDLQAGAGPAWVAEHSSYVYLGRDGVSESDLPAWGDLVVAHLKLDRGFAVEPSKRNPEGHVYVLSFLDSHAEVCDRALAERLIARSVRVYDAAAKGEPFDDVDECRLDMQLIARAIRA